MVHHIPLTKARINLGQIVRRAHVNKEHFVLEKDGIPVAGIVGMEDLDEILEMHDPEIKKQINEGYQEYLHGETKDTHALFGKKKKKEHTEDILDLAGFLKPKKVISALKARELFEKHYERF
ncbi:MAG: type II toxin-antitoxin system Phd/YefM family antitoxin [Parcubacteria group bacterium]|nr:type II toxin-antitoxin system Phd/YefM family antitoxin [Parcubacteria group bacterium]